MSKRGSGGYWIFAGVVLMFTAGIALPGFSFFYWYLDAPPLFALFCGVLSGVFVWQTVEFLTGLVVATARIWQRRGRKRDGH